MAASSRRMTALAILMIPLALVVSLIARGCVPDLPPPDVHLVFPAGEIRIAVDASYPAFALATDDGPVGLDIDLGRAIAERLGVEVRFENIGYDGLYDAIIAGRADIIISQLLINPLQMGDVHYTRPYFDAGLVLVSSEATPLERMNDLPGHSLAYEFGSSADADIHEWSRRILPFETQPYELPQYALDAVRLGVADAALTDAVTARLYLREHPNWQATSHYVTSAQFAIGVPIDHEDEWFLIDRALGELMEEGVVAEIIDRWL